ncbi:MAG TPA: hypothetical protein PKU97_24275, partial [Kofleriaceae bacterium]|nr:hypothetical protein [Kofleriaceae bacterium]
MDGEWTFVRPAVSQLGDGYCQRREIAERKTARRICLVGESVALGFLYAPHLTPALVLEQQLNALAGAGSHEVVDLSKSSESLFPLTETVESALQLEPDAFVIFVGNNWNFQESDTSPYIPVPAFRARFARALRQGGVAAARALGGQILQDKAAHAMRLLAKAAAARSIPVVVMVPEVNLADWETRQPVLWRSGDGAARWHALYERAVSCLARAEYEAALELASQMLALDEGTGPSGFRIQATAYRGLGRLEDAARAARAEVDSDVMATMCYLHCPQATTAVQESLRQAGREHGFTVVDLPSVFAAHSGDSLPGRRYFVDYCHLTAEGMTVAMAPVTAALLRGAVGAGGAGPTWETVLASTPPPPLAPEVDAVAKLGAAIHSAHRLQALTIKGELLEHWCAQALAASPGIAEAMFELVELRCSPGPALLSRAAQRNL